MDDSILDDIKHMLGILPEDTAFDSDIVIFVNGVFTTLTQLGVGPREGFMIQDHTQTWSEFFTDPRLNAVKSYIYLCVKMNFNPPEIGAVAMSMERQKTELEYRLNVVAEYDGAV